MELRPVLHEFLCLEHLEIHAGRGERRRIPIYVAAARVCSSAMFPVFDAEPTGEREQFLCRGVLDDAPRLVGGRGQLGVTLFVLSQPDDAGVIL